MTLTGVSAETRVDAVLDAVSSAKAGEYGMSAATETAANTVVFRSRKQPSESLTGTLYITQGEPTE